jgi:hypothetical protein
MKELWLRRKKCKNLAQCSGADLWTERGASRGVLRAISHAGNGVLKLS